MGRELNVTDPDTAQAVPANRTETLNKLRESVRSGSSTKSSLPPPGEHRINANIPKPLWMRFTAQAKREKMTATALIVRIMAEYIADREQNEPHWQRQLFADAPGAAK